MSYVNIWIAIPEDDHNELNNRRGTANNVGPARDFVNGQLDPAIVQKLYATHQQGQTVRHLWSVILREDSIPNSVNEFRQEFPGAQVLGCWTPGGWQYGKTPEYGPTNEYLGSTGTPLYEISDQLINYMPNGVLEDVNLPAGWNPREFT